MTHDTAVTHPITEIVMGTILLIFTGFFDTFSENLLSDFMLILPFYRKCHVGKIYTQQCF